MALPARGRMTMRTSWAVSPPGRIARGILNQVQSSVDPRASLYHFHRHLRRCPWVVLRMGKG